jgi:cell division septum initiation protein DivIVA
MTEPIYSQPFPRSIFGYNPKSVDSFMKELGKEFEKLTKENADLKETIKKLHQGKGK